MANIPTASFYEGSFDRYNPGELARLGQFLSDRNNFIEEQPMIVTACADEGRFTVIESVLASGAASRGAHSVKLGRVSKNIYIFALKMLGADYGAYISGDKNSFFIECVTSAAAPIEDFSKAFKAYDAPAEYKEGRISGYTEIIEKYLKKP